jgi:hypothetical protein
MDVVFHGHARRKNTIIRSQFIFKPVHPIILVDRLYLISCGIALQTWSEVMYINFHGCDNAPSVYQMDGNGETDAFILRCVSRVLISRDLLYFSYHF